MATPSEEWMPREQWEALVRGDGCSACGEVTSNEHGSLVHLCYSVARRRLSSGVSGRGRPPERRLPMERSLLAHPRT